MFYKNIDNRSYMYFPSNPPRPEQDETSPDKKAKPPYPGAKSYQCSVYYYWWEFLRLNQDYRERRFEPNSKMAEVFQDFGDVHNDDFVQWWIDTGRNLFRDPRQSVMIIDGREVGQSPADYVYLAIPRIGDFKRVLTEIDNMLRPNIIDDDRVAAQGGPKYPLFTTPHLESLHKLLIFAKHDLAEGEPSLSDLTDWAEQEFERIYPHQAGQNEFDEKKAGTYRYEYRKLIENVGLGEFPKKKDAKRKR
jgi:hypothetical protein